jgi:flagella basal body P-ring formation protein FlgA
VRTLLLIGLLLPLSKPVLGGEKAINDTREVIIEMATESLMANYDAKYYRFELSARWIPGSLLHADPTHIERVQLQGAVAQYTKFVVAYKRHNQIRTQQIQLKVEAKQKLPVSNHRLISGKILKAEDFDWRWVPFVVGREHPINDIKELAGKTLRQMLQAGEPVFPSAISAPFLVEAGEDVELIYTEHGIQIVLGCEARQSGSKGEDISIYCKETRKKYLGRIESPGVAQWQKTL